MNTILNRFIVIFIFVVINGVVLAEAKEEVIINGEFEGLKEDVLSYDTSKKRIAERWHINPGATTQSKDGKIYEEGTKIITDSSIAHTGNNCLHTESDPAIEGSVIGILYVPYNKEQKGWVQFGEKYVLEAWVKADKPNSKMYLCCYQYAEDGTRFVVTVTEPLDPKPPFTLTDEWKKYVFEYTPTKQEIDTVGIAIHIYGSAYIDDVSFFPKE